MWIAIAIVGVIALAVIGLLVTARSRATTGRLSRETRKRDEAAGASTVASAAAPAGEESVAEATDEGRARADEARRAIESGGSTVPEPARRGDARGLRAGRPRRARRHPAAVLQPFDPRRVRSRPRRLRCRGARLPLAAARQRLRRQDRRRLGGRRQRPPFGNKMPFYNATAKTYIVAYPKADLPKAKKVTAYTPPIIAGMEAGLRRALPEVRAPRLPGAVVPELAVVRVPVPRLEVQPGR